MLYAGKGKISMVPQTISMGFDSRGSHNRMLQSNMLKDKERKKAPFIPIMKFGVCTSKLVPLPPSCNRILFLLQKIIISHVLCKYPSVLLMNFNPFVNFSSTPILDSQLFPITHKNCMLFPSTPSVSLAY